jgi:electron transfer flavoprotein alpha subunit
MPAGAEFVELQTQKRDRPDLTEARVVVSGGRGMKEGKNFAILEQLCDLLGGAIGCKPSRLRRWNGAK